MANCNTQFGFYVIRSEKDKLEISDAKDNKVIYTDDKNGGYTHISCIEGKVFLVKDKNVFEVNLPIDPKEKPTKYVLDEKPVYFIASNEDKND